MKKNIIKHLTKGRSPNIVDISKKKETKRIAIAEGFRDDRKIIVLLRDLYTVLVLLS